MNEISLREKTTANLKAVYEEKKGALESYAVQSFISGAITVLGGAVMLVILAAVAPLKTAEEAS